MSTLITDTSSLINLYDIYIGKTHISDLLIKLFTVRVPNEITQEVRRHRGKFYGYDLKFLNLTIQARRRFHRQNDYENILRHGFAPACNPQRNRGERFNCSLGLYLVRKKITDHIILLSDDMNAYRGFVGWFEERFRVTSTWSSLDLLLYLYMSTYPKWPIAQAKQALRAVNARMSGPSAAELLKRLTTYRRYIDDSHALLSTLPYPRRKGAL
jgi:hypothetical protein